MADEPQAQVRFITQLDERFRVTEAPIQLPTRLRRSGLSEVINHLLGTPEDKPRPFDFLLNNELLRGSLAQGMERYGLTGEVVVTLEYVDCIPPPQPEKSCAHKDWVSALTAHPSSRLLLSACYDHTAYVWGAMGQPMAALIGHTGPVKGVTWLSGSDEGGSLRAATASKDMTVRTWRVAPPAGGVGEASTSCEAVLVGHTSSIEAIVTNPAGTRLCSGAWDGTMLLWSASDAAAAATDAAAAAGEACEDASAPPSKRAKGSKEGAVEAAATPTAVATPELTSSETFSGHHSCVGALCWPTAALLYSGSHDGTVREWQLDVGSPSATLAGQAAVLALDVNLTSGLIATGHTDHQLRVWDSRLQQGAMQLAIPHKSWVNDARWCPTHTNLLATACYDGVVRLWDVRSTTPLHELTTHAGKALCLAWDAGERVASGGTDSQLRLAALSLPG